MIIVVQITERAGKTRQLTFDQSEVIIGRYEGNEIFLPSGNVSKRHARIYIKDGRVIIADLKSTNGIYVNGNKTSAPQLIKPSDTIIIGDFTIRAKYVKEGSDYSFPESEQAFTPPSTLQSILSPPLESESLPSLQKEADSKPPEVEAKKEAVQKPMARKKKKEAQTEIDLALPKKGEDSVVIEKSLSHKQEESRPALTPSKKVIKGQPSIRGSSNPPAQPSPNAPVQVPKTMPETTTVSAEPTQPQPTFGSAAPISTDQTPTPMAPSPMAPSPMAPTPMTPTPVRAQAPLSSPPLNAPVADKAKSNLTRGGGGHIPQKSRSAAQPSPSTGTSPAFQKQPMALQAPHIDPTDQKLPSMLQEITGSYGKYSPDTIDAMPFEPSTEEHLHRKGVVRFYEQMNPEKLFPLLVSIIQAKKYIKKADVSGVQQTEGQHMEIKKSSPHLKIVPVFPGCTVYPTEMVIDTRSKKADAHFWMTPHIEGDLSHSARVQIWHEGVLREEIPVPCKVTTQTLTKVASFASVFSTFGGAFFENYGHMLTKSSNSDSSVSGYVLHQLLSVVGASGIWFGVLFLGAAVGCYYWLKPKEGEEIKRFLKTELQDELLDS